MHLNDPVDIMLDTCIPNKKKLIFVLERPAAVPEDAVLIDWDTYLLTRMRQLELPN